MLQNKCEVLGCPSVFPARPYGGPMTANELPEGWYHRHTAPPMIDGTPVRGAQLTPQPRLVCPLHPLPAYDGHRGLTVRCGALNCTATAEAGHVDTLPQGWTLVVQGLESIDPEEAFGQLGDRAQTTYALPMRKMLYLTLCPAHPAPAFEPLPDCFCFGHPHSDPH